MCTDIEREINWARNGESAGNALCALGLLSYTEAMAYLLPPERRPQGGSRQHFDAFFCELGQPYADLIHQGSINVYDVFRCGLSHEYFVKHTCTIAMMNSTSGSLEVKGPRVNAGPHVKRAQSELLPKPANCGLGICTNGSYYFIVEKYYQDFRAACERLHLELKARDPKTPPTLSYAAMSSSDGP
jgi:hypothetical protein